MQDHPDDRLAAEAVAPRVQFGRGFDDPPPIEPLPEAFAAIAPIAPIAITAEIAPPHWLLPARNAGPQRAQQQHRMPRPAGIVGRPRSRERRARPTRIGGCSRAGCGAERADPHEHPSFAWLAPFVRGMTGPELMAFFFDNTPLWLQVLTWQDVARRARQEWDR